MTLGGGPTVPEDVTFDWSATSADIDAARVLHPTLVLTPTAAPIAPTAATDAFSRCSTPPMSPPPPKPSPIPTPPPSPPLVPPYADMCASSVDRLLTFTDVMTRVMLQEEGYGVRIVQSSGGVASNSVVSEGQGYGLLIAASTAAGLDAEDTRYGEPAVAPQHRLHLSDSTVSLLALTRNAAHTC